VLFVVTSMKTLALDQF